MANTDKTIDSEVILLYDNWPGPVEDREAPYGDGLLDKRYHNISIPAVRIGTKIQIPMPGNVGKEGPCIMIYLQVGTQDANTALAVKSVVVPDSATLWYQVTDDADSLCALPTKLFAFAISAMTDAYYGWFWCGGVCPEELVPAMGGTYLTDGSVVAGHILAHDLSQDNIGLGPCSAVNEDAGGFCFAAADA